MSTPPLFTACPLPGCRNDVDDPREPCGECRTAFGDQLRPSGAVTPPAEYAAQLAARDAAVAAVHQARKTGTQPAGDTAVT